MDRQLVRRSDRKLNAVTVAVWKTAVDRGGSADTKKWQALSSRCWLRLPLVGTEHPAHLEQMKFDS